MSQISLDFGAGALLVAGIDEAGRGPLAGPVVAAAVVLDPARPIDGLGDSKALSAARRETLELAIKEHALCWAVARAEVEEIDRINILQATLQAMRRAVLALDPAPSHALVDGNQLPPLPCSCDCVVNGDAQVASIGAASILAKVARDREMIEMDSVYPGYGFASHKGYGTREHLDALGRLGATPIHRRSFAPVRSVLGQTG